MAKLINRQTIRQGWDEASLQLLELSRGCGQGWRLCPRCDFYMSALAAVHVGRAFVPVAAGMVPVGVLFNHGKNESVLTVYSPLGGLRSFVGRLFYLRPVSPVRMTGLHVRPFLTAHTVFYQRETIDVYAETLGFTPATKSQITGLESIHHQNTKHQKHIN